MKIFSSLKRSQKEAIGLLQIGTFLEYFDLMLYVHMAILLNDLFFPKTDPHTGALLTAFTFCSTYVLRPFGALLFGYIGDNIGRKATVIITTTMMALSSIIMGSLPTYAEIGIIASWIMMICRILQGFSSMGEIIGAQIYMVEITKPPIQAFATSLVGCSSRVGSVAALGMATLVTSYNFNWRIGFWIGATIALVGSAARTRLRETPEFVDMKLRMQKAIEEANEDGLGAAARLLQKTNKIWQEKVSFKNTLALFFTEAVYAIFFYFTFIHCGIILKNTFGYSPEEIISQNFIMGIFQMISYFFCAFLTFKVDALKIVKMRAWIFLPFVIIFPFLMQTSISSTSFFWIQAFFSIFSFVGGPALAVFYSFFPIFKRFRYVSFIYALSRALVYIVTSFGLTYLTESFGYWGTYILFIPSSIAFMWSIRQFEKSISPSHNRLPTVSN